MELQNAVILKMIEFNKGDPKRIQHFLKVYEFTHLIALNEGMEKNIRDTLEIASIVHDIAIVPCEKKYGHCNGKIQEEEGPAYARELLKDFSEISQNMLERICYLIAHHHTYTDVDGLDYRILLEADFLVNAFEDELPQKAILNAREKIFETKTGTDLLNTMYSLTQKKKLGRLKSMFQCNNEELLQSLNYLFTLPSL